MKRGRRRKGYNKSTIVFPQPDLPYFYLTAGYLLVKFHFHYEDMQLNRHKTPHSGLFKDHNGESSLSSTLIKDGQQFSTKSV